MSITRITFAALGTAAVALTGLGPATAHAATTQATAAAAGDVCHVQPVRLEARNIQEDQQGTDEIRLRLGNTTTPQHSYFAGQVRNLLSETGDTFSGRTTVNLVEVDANTRTSSRQARIECTGGTREVTLRDNGNDMVYQLRYVVDILP